MGKKSLHKSGMFLGHDPTQPQRPVKGIGFASTTTKKSAATISKQPPLLTRVICIKSPKYYWLTHWQCQAIIRLGSDKNLYLLCSLQSQKSVELQQIFAEVDVQKHGEFNYTPHVQVHVFVPSIRSFSVMFKIIFFALDDRKTAFICTACHGRGEVCLD